MYLLSSCYTLISYHQFQKMRRKQGRLKPGGIVFSPKGAEDNSAGKDAATEEKDANTEKADANTEDTDANTNAKTRDSKERDRDASTEVPARNERLKHTKSDSCDQEDKRRTRNTRQSEPAGKVTEQAGSSKEENITHSKTEKLLSDNIDTVPQVCCGRTQAVHIRRYDLFIGNSHSFFESFYRKLLAIHVFFRLFAGHVVVLWTLVTWSLSSSNLFALSAGGQRWAFFVSIIWNVSPFF